LLSVTSKVTAVGVVLGSVGVVVGVAGSVASGATTAVTPTPNDHVESTAVDPAASGASAAAGSTDGDWTPPRRVVMPTATRPIHRSARLSYRSRSVHRRTTVAHRRPPRASRSEVRRPLPSDPRSLAHALVLRRGWDEQQWRCLDLLWTRESNWRVHETNDESGAYGIPQSLPGSKMAQFGADWRDNPVTQIRWGLWYIDERYGTPCAAWEHSELYNYY
jgi:hypothetical protein